MKPLAILVLSCLSLLSLRTLMLFAAGSIQDASTPAATELSQRLEAAVAARNTGDPVAISRASKQVISLALVQMAKMRLDARAYDEAVKFCSDSLEFEDTVETRIELAIANLYAKKPSDAIKQASTATEMDPQNALGWTIKGEALLRTKDYVGATSALERSIELKEDAEPLYALGMAQLGAGKKEKAAESFAHMLTLVGDAGWSRVLIGRAYQQQNQLQEAVAEFQNALWLDPRTPNAHYFWAWTLLQANNWSMTPEARSHLQEELRLNPRHFLSVYLLAVFASIERSYDESDSYLRLAADLNPNVPEIWMYLGLNEYGRNVRGMAESYLRKAILLTERGNPKEHWSIPQAYFVLGRILLSSGRKKEGEGFIKKSQELANLMDSQMKGADAKTNDGIGVAGGSAPYVPEADGQNTFLVNSNQGLAEGMDSHPQRRPFAKSSQDPAGKAEARLRTILGSALNDLATADALDQKYDLALKRYHEAAFWDAQIPGLERNLGLAAFFAGQPSEAIRLLSKIVRQTPSDSHARAVLGLAYFATQDFTRAVQTVTPIANQALQDPQLGLAWAKSLARTGNRAKAVRALQGLQKANANLTVNNLVQLGQLWQELGEAQRAEQSFQRALLIDPENPDAKCALHLADCP